MLYRQFYFNFITYIELRSFNKITSGAAINQYEGAGTKTVNMFSKLVSQGSNFVMEGVKNLVVKRHVCSANLELHI